MPSFTLLFKDRASKQRAVIVRKLMQSHAQPCDAEEGSLIQGMRILKGANSVACKVREGYEGLAQFVSSLPQEFDRTGTVMYQDRNVVKKVEIPQGAFVVKCFTGMYMFNRLAYSLFRKSKAERSYLYSQVLNTRGIDTPPHIAWIDCYTFGFLTRSYFVSVFYPYDTLFRIISLNLYDQERKALLLRDLAAFTIKFHRSGLYHPDFSMGNLLVMPKERGFEFAVVDLNRVKVRTVSFEEGLKNLVTLRLPEEDMNMLITEFASQSGKEPQSCIKTFWEMRARAGLRRRFRKTIRRYTVEPFEKLLTGNDKLSGARPEV